MATQARVLFIGGFLTNSYGEFGLGHDHEILLNTFIRYIHSARLWDASNDGNECLIEDLSDLDEPHRVNLILKKHHNIKHILQVAQGYFSTALVCCVEG